METAPPVIIPTLSRSKISRNLSYPIGAETISIALTDAPQLHDLKLRFYFGSDAAMRRRRYEFLRVEYLHKARPASEWPISSLYKRPPQYRWELVVQPVPRTHRHRTKLYTVDSALPKINMWLQKRGELAQKGTNILAFFYDQEDDEFTPRELTKLEPLLLARHQR